MDIIIEYLTDHPEFISTVAKWHHDQWSHILPNFTLTQYTRFLSSHYKKSGIPTMLVAVQNNKVIGTAALDDYDMDTHPELSPWIASLYVEKNHRKKGAGAALVRRIIEEARSSNIKKLYLFTHDQERFLARFGWKTLFREKYYGEPECVMVLELSPHTPSR